MDPVSAALVTWATGQAGTSTLRVLERAWWGDPQKNTLTKITREAIVAAVEEAVAAPDRAPVAEALSRDYSESTHTPLPSPTDLRQAILAMVGPTIEVLGDQGYDIDADLLADSLVARLASGVRADAARNGILRPLADLMAQDAIVQELRTIRETVNRVVRPARDLADEDSVTGPLHPASWPGDVQIGTSPWLGHLTVRSEVGKDIADQLLAADPRPLNDEDSPLSDLQELVTKVFSIEELSVAVTMASEPIAVRVASQDQFWAAVLSDFALRRSDPKSMKWLMQQTVGKDGRPLALTRLDAIWDFIEQTFLAPESSVNREDLMRRLVDACLQTTGRTRLKGQIHFLLNLSMTDAALKLTIRTAIEDFCQAHADLSPERLGDLIRLIGDCGGPTSFVPGLVKIRPTGSWPYAFEVMRLPLTVGQVGAIFPALAEDGANPQLPFRFAPPEMFQADREFYVNLKKELMIILSRVHSQADEVDGMRWDIPTFREWLRLAGCEHQRFPWGDTFDRPDRANLRISGRKPRIQPVGSFRAGVSSGGVQDCCGNVYEIVRVSEGDEVPHSFGLMGQDYRTPADAADCSRLGYFWPRRHDHRRNVGIRLIRYNAQDEDKRIFRY